MGFIVQTSCCSELKKKFLNFKFWSFRSCIAEVIDPFTCKAESGVRVSQCYEGTYCLLLQAFINLTILNGWRWKMTIFQNVGISLPWNWVWKLKTVWARTETEDCLGTYRNWRLSGYVPKLKTVWARTEIEDCLGTYRNWRLSGYVPKLRQNFPKFPQKWL